MISVPNLHVLVFFFKIDILMYHVYVLYKTYIYFNIPGYYATFTTYLQNYNLFSLPDVKVMVTFWYSRSFGGVLGFRSNEFLTQLLIIWLYLIKTNFTKPPIMMDAMTQKKYIRFIDKFGGPYRYQ